MSKQKAQGASRTGLPPDAGKSKMTTMLTRQLHPRHLLDKTKEELYAITKDSNIIEGREHVVKTIRDILFMDDIDDNIDNLSTLSHALLKTTQLKDVPKPATAVIRAIARAINNVQEVLKEQEVAMELTMDTRWTTLQIHMSNIEKKLGSLTSVIESQDHIIKALQIQHSNQQLHQEVN